MKEDERREAIRIWLSEREKHSIASKKYRRFRDQFKTISPKDMTSEMFREYLEQKDSYSEACKARNQAEIEFKIAMDSSTVSTKDPKLDIRMADLMKIFDKATKKTPSIPSIPLPKDVGIMEVQQEKYRERYNLPTQDDPAFERMKEQALRGLGLRPPVSEQEIQMPPSGELELETENMREDISDLISPDPEFPSEESKYEEGESE